MQYQILACFSEMVNWSDIRSRLPENLKVSPLVVIPQVGRRDRLLLDLSFPVQAARPTSKRGQRRVDSATASSTLCQLHHYTTIARLSGQRIRTSPAPSPNVCEHRPSHPRKLSLFAKIDLPAMDFGACWCKNPIQWNFAYVLPGTAEQPIRLIIPHALQMGWTESPGYFCAATETGRGHHASAHRRRDPLAPGIYLTPIWRPTPSFAGKAPQPQ